MGKGGGKGGAASKLAHEVLELIEKALQKLRKRSRGGHEGAGHGTHPHGKSDPHAPGKHHGDGGSDGHGEHHTGDDDGRGPARSQADNRGDHDTPRRDRNGQGDPIDMANGAVLQTQTDVSLPGVLPLVLQRHYISTYQLGGWFGRTWASTLDMRLEVDDEGVVFVTDDGMLLVYPAPPAAGGVLPSDGPRWPLTRAGVGYAVTDPHRGWSWHFAPPPGGARGDGGPLVLPIAAITNRVGDRIDLWYAEDGAVEEVRHSGGYRVGVDSAEGRVTALRLANPASGTDETLIRFSYNHLGHLTEVANASGQPLQFDYDPAGRMTSWQDRNGSWYRYTYDAAGRCVRGDGADGFLSATIAYDTDARVTTYTDSLGHTRHYYLDARGKTIREVDALGHTTHREWDDNGRVVAETDPLGHTTTHAYDHTGSVASVVRPDGSRAEFTYNELSQPVTFTDFDGTVTSHTYDDHGNLTSVSDRTGAVTRYGYDPRGHLASVTDPLGHTTTIACDPAGLPITVTDPTGATTRYIRDHTGRVAAATDPLGNITRYGYTPEGKPAWRTGPDDATETWIYDGEGNLTAYVDPTGATTQFEHTHFDLPSIRTDPDGARYIFGYDTELRLTQVTNPQGLTWRYDYDPAGRLTAETDFNSRTLIYAHDAAGQLLARTNGLGQTISYTRDLLGNITMKQSPDDTTRYFHDLAGRLTRAVSDTADLTLAYDPVGRVLAQTVNGATLTSTYDPAGRRTGRRTPTGADSYWTYDERGDATALHTAGHSLSFAHDPAGRQTGRTLVGPNAGGLHLAHSYDANHRLLAQTVTTRPATADGSSRAPSDAGTWGTTGTTDTVVHRGYQYRADGLLSAIDDATTGRRSFDIDRAGRISAVTAHDWTEHYAYDPAGNLTRAAWTNPTADDVQGDREYAGTLIRRAGGVRYEHDAHGRVVLRQHKQLSAKPLTWRYTYNSDDRLTAVACPDGTTWTYVYDPLGRRIAKCHYTADGQLLEQTSFCWDGTRLAEQVHWAAPSAAPQATTWDYQPDTFTPITQTDRHWLATADQTEIDQRFHAIITDLVGTPTELVTPDGHIAWHTQTTIWGTTTAMSAGTSVDCPLRFPGQYHDPETGLHYNHHRYYDPATARYTTTDTLGLTPAPNPHTYVPNPTALIDPLGLAASDDYEGAPDDVFVRRGTDWESGSRLGRQAQAAEDTGRFPHGVSVTSPASNSRLSHNPDDAMTAPRQQIEAAGFHLQHTPTRTDADHHTLVLPKPVTPEVARAFNRLFGRSR